MLKEKDLAIDFSLPDASGKMVKLSDFKGKKIVLYFYPKDNTPGCTKQACSFRDNYHEYCYESDYSYLMDKKLEAKIKLLLI